MNLARVVVVGTSCSGKTTLAHRLASKLGTRYVELDSLYWGLEGELAVAAEKEGREPEEVEYEGHHEPGLSLASADRSITWRRPRF